MFGPPNAREGFGNHCPGQSPVSDFPRGGGGMVVGRGSSSKAQVASAGWPSLLMAASACPSPAGVGASQVMAGGSGPVQVKDSPLLLQQIEAMQLSIKHLKNENNRLKVSGSQ